MKMITAAILGLFFFQVALPALSQPSGMPEDMSREAILGRRKAIVSESMKLTEREEKYFWPIYERFQIRKNNLSDRSAALIHKFIANYESLDKALATELLKESLRISQEELKIKREMIRALSEDLSPVTVIRFHQIEEKLEAIVNFDLRRQVPVAR